MAALVAMPPQFGRYRIVQTLGAGGMGAVYLAEDTLLSRKVALKVPHFTADDGPTVLERFLREARTAAAIDHPNLCPIYDTGEVNGIHYLVMPFIEGKPLSRLIDEDHPWTADQALALVKKLALALQVLHERGMMHRDLKPSNVMIRANGEPVIMDFGLARSLTQQSRQLTRMGSMLGTPAYMAPEQVLGELKLLGPATDVYGLGVILYELLTGQLPFEGPPTVVCAQILHAAPEAPSARRPGLESWLDAVCLKALTKKPEERYATMTEFALALERAVLAPTMYTTDPGDHPTNARPQPQTTKVLPLPNVPEQIVASVTCPTCSKKLKVPSGVEGKKLFCPRCQTNLTRVEKTLRKTSMLAPWSDLAERDRPPAIARQSRRLAATCLLASFVLVLLLLTWLYPKRVEENANTRNSQFVQLLKDSAPKLRVGFTEDHRWGLSLIGQKDPNNPKEEKKLTFSRSGETNNTVIRINDYEFIFGSRVHTRAKVEERIEAIKDKMWSTKIKYVESGVEVTQHVLLLPGASEDLEVALIYYTIENKGSQRPTVGVRVLLDTYIGSNDGVPFTIPGRKGFMDTMAILPAKDLPDFIEAVEDPDNLKDQGTVARLGLNLKGLELPEMNIPELNERTKTQKEDSKGNKLYRCKYPPVSGFQEITKLVICQQPENPQVKWEWGDREGEFLPIATPPKKDSCVVMYWDPLALDKGESRVIGFTYGLNSLDVKGGEAGAGLALTTNQAVAVNMEFTVTAIVYNPRPNQPVTLELPEGIELVKGEDAQKNVPPGETKQKRTSLHWRVKATTAGAKMIKAKSGSTESTPRTLRVRAGSLSE